MSQTDYWLVGTKGSSQNGDEITGGPSKIVESVTQPKGYSYTHDLGPSAGQTAAGLEKELATALVSLPTGISIASTYNIPGLGTLHVGGPGGIAGDLDKAATGTGQVAQTAQNLATGDVLASVWTSLTNPSNWLRALEVLGAVVAIYLGIRSLTGAPGVVETAEALKP